MIILAEVLLPDDLCIRVISTLTLLVPVSRDEKGKPTVPQ